MQIEQLESMERAATPGPWIDEFSPLPNQDGENWALLRDLRNAIPALLRLWRAARELDEHTTCGQSCLHLRRIHGELRSALAELDALEVPRG